MNPHKSPISLPKKIQILLKAEVIARNLLILKYVKDTSFHDIKIINDIIFNEETHFVAIFKEYLIYEEINEYLKRFYFKKEIKHKMPEILFFYDKYSKIYPNYTNLPESKYMYKNIKRKQKMIDKLQENEEEELEMTSKNYTNLFTTKVLETIDSFTMSVYKEDSSDNNDCNVNSSINNLINKIFLYQKEKQNKFNVIRKINKSKAKLFITRIKKNINKKINQASFLTKKISKLLSPSLKSKALDKNNNNKKKVNYFFSNQFNLKHKNISEKSLGKSNSHTAKAVLSTNSSRSKTERKFSSPTTLHNKKAYFKLHSSTNIKYNRNNSSNIGNSINNNNSKKSLSKPKSKPLYHSKIFSNRNSKKNNYTSIGVINSNTLENKSKSTQKKRTKGSYSIVSNLNIVNNIQSGSTQINIYNYNDILRSLHFNSGSVLHSSIIRKNAQKGKSPLNHSKSKSRSNPKQQKNFELNKRKFFHWNNIEQECSTDRNLNNNWKRLFEKLGKNYFQKKSLLKINSVGISKINSTESKINSRKNSKHHTSVSKKSKNKQEKKSSNKKVKYSHKIKLKSLHDLGNFMFKNASNKIINSERGKKSKISIK